MFEWNNIEDGLPPAGVPLIVTVDGKGCERGPKLAYPVIYRKSFIHDEWRFYEHGYEDGLIGPKYFRVTAWARLPKPYTGEKPKCGYRPGGTTCWVSVEEGLPEPGQETWVYALPPAEIDAEPEIDTDTFDGNRGDTVKYTGPNGDGEDIASGWYTYSGWTVTHWMPIIKPEAPIGTEGNKEET